MFIQNPGARPFGALLLVLFLVMGIFPVIFPVSTAAQEIVHFSDPQLEKAVRQALDRPTGLLAPADLAPLRSLEAGRQNIKSLSGLEHALNLESLNLYQNKIENIAPLQGLIKLKALNLGNNQINDITPLQQLKALEELDLSHNRIKAIDTITNMTDLRFLHLEGNEIKALAPLAPLKALESLYLSNSPGDKDLTPLARLARLQKLELSGGGIEDISFLSGLKQLQHLELCDNRIENLEPLRSLARLEWLSLANNKVEDITALGGLRLLQYLDLSNNRVRQIAPLLKLRNMQCVELQNNYLELEKGAAAQLDLEKLLANAAEVITHPQKLPICSGNGLVTAGAGSGGQLLRTPVDRYFTVLNYTAGWRIKNFTVVHEGGKPRDYVREVGRRSLPGAFCWYSTSGNSSVGEEKDAFYKATFDRPGPVQLGLAVQLWPGYADDAARSFYISQVELINVETGDLHTVELDRDAPPAGNRLLPGTDSPSPDHQAKTASSLIALQKTLAEAQKKGVSSLEVCYRGEALKMPDDAEAILEKTFAEDDYLRYSLRSYNIRWSGKPGGELLLNFNFQYLATPEEEDFVEKKVRSILKGTLTPGMNDRQKTKAIHDYVVANVAYDLNYRENSAHAALVKGRAVCQGYALLLYKMLEEAGVRSRIVSGEAGGEKHLWNLVSQGGNWYHIDATWNDPVPDVPNRIRYDYYNRTDEQMAATHSWNRALYPAARTPDK